jgi:hypothetical protein
MVLSGCTDFLPDDPILTVERNCMTANTSFIDGWGCVQAQSLTGKMGASDTRVQSFMKYGDDLATQVSAKTLTSTEAKRRLSASVEPR